jgi:transcriptional regulator with XRE-family HTH domain
MDSSEQSRKVVSDGFGSLLRYWREVRGVSQFELSIDSGVSQRHISFIESGRSVPGRQTLLNIAQSLDVPLRERNALLLAAGYAPMYPEAKWNAEEMSSVTNAISRLLRQHEPFPAIVMDRYWNVLTTNESAPRLFNHFINTEARPGPRNLLHLIFDPQGMRPYVVQWELVARSLLQRVYREAVGHMIDAQTQQLLDELHAYPGVQPEWKWQGVVDPSAGIPMIPVGFTKNGSILNYFSMITTVGAPQSIAAQELRIEFMFPADNQTEDRHAKLFASSRSAED